MTRLAWPKPPFAATPTERNALSVRPKLSLRKWAETYIRLTAGPLVGDSQTPIPWSCEHYPLQRTICEALDDRRWSLIVLMTPPQAFGKTQCAALPLILYTLQYRGEDCYYVAADETLAKKQWTRKIEPAIRAHPELATLLYDNPDLGGTWESRKFTNKTALHMAGGNAPLAGDTAPVIIFDDVQAYAESLPAGRGHMVDDGRKRSASYSPDQIRHVVIGTATTDEAYLTRSLKSGTLYCPFVPCPACGTYQILSYDRLQYDRENPLAAKQHTTHTCAHADCGHAMIFEELPEMLRNHLWVSCPPDEDWISQPPEGGVIIDPAAADVYPNTARPTTVASFWANDLYWPLGASWGDRAEELVNLKGDPDKLRDHQVNCKVVPYKQPEVDEERLTVEEVETHKTGGHIAGTVPAEADLVTGTVDVQSAYTYYIFRAWKRATGDSWLVTLKTEGKPTKTQHFESKDEQTAYRLRGITRALTRIDEIAQEGFPVVDAEGTTIGRIHPILCLVDVGYEPTVVGNWWSEHHRGIWRMIRGKGAGPTAVLWPPKPSLDKRKRPFRHVGVNEAKTLLRKLMRIPPGQPGYLRLPGKGVTAATFRAYFNHLASEQFDVMQRVPRWEKVTPGVANHYLDCETYQICAAYACGVQLPYIEIPEQQKSTAPQRAMRDPSSSRTNRQSNWTIGRR